MLNKLNYDLLLNKNKLNFIQLQLENKLVIQRKEISDINKELVQFNFTSWKVLKQMLDKLESKLKSVIMEDENDEEIVDQESDFD